MTIQEKLDAVLVFCVRTSKEIGVSPDSLITFDAEDMRKGAQECELKDQGEFQYYLRSLSDMGMLKILTLAGGFQITISGFMRAESLGV